MRLKKFIIENESTKEYSETDVKKLIDSLSDIPSSTPENIANYILKNIKASGIKFDNRSMTYLSGPMTNIPDTNWPTFMIAEEYIGGKVFNPARPHGFLIKKPKTEFTWSDFMVEDVYNLLQCNKIVVLPGWSKSTGAVTEVYIIEKLLKYNSVELRKHIGGTYDDFVEDVKFKYYSDGNNDGFDSVIYPMLMSKSESEASKYVKPYIPVKSKSNVNEGIVDYIVKVISSLKKASLVEFLHIMGSVLDKNHVTKIVR